MDLLLDYGDLGAIVRAGFSSSKPLPCSNSSPYPLSHSSFPAFPSPHLPCTLPPSPFSFPAPFVPSSSLFPPSVSSTFHNHHSSAASSSSSSSSVFSPSIAHFSARKIDPVDFISTSISEVHGISCASTQSFSLQCNEIVRMLPQGMVTSEEGCTRREPSGLSSGPALAVSEKQNEMHHNIKRLRQSNSSSSTHSQPWSLSFHRHIIAEGDGARPCTSFATAYSGETSTGVSKKPTETELSSSDVVSNRGRSAKRRKLLAKRVVQIPAIGAVTSRPSAGENVPCDSWAWRKYGQKPIKGSPHPRGYYRCSSSKGCPARKQVERNPKDPSMLVVTYTSEHNHPSPTHRANPPVVASTLDPKSPSAGSTSNELSPQCSNYSPLKLDVDDGPSSTSPLSQGDTVGDDDLGQQPGERDLANSMAFTASWVVEAGACQGSLPASTASASTVQTPGMVRECAKSDVESGLAAARLSCGEDEAQLFDALLGEMLEEVQRQNREEEEEEAILFNLFSQVNHVVQ